MCLEDAIENYNRHKILCYVNFIIMLCYDTSTTLFIEIVHNVNVCNLCDTSVEHSCILVKFQALNCVLNYFVASSSNENSDLKNPHILSFLFVNYP